MHTLIIKLHGEFCNEYPKLLLKVNDRVLFNDYIVNNIFEIPIVSDTVLYLEHYEKCFGKNHKWDTKTQNGIIIQDKKIVIDDILLNDLSFKSSLNKFKFIQNPLDKEPLIQFNNWNGVFNFNGSVTITINGNPFSWLTNLLYKKEISNLSYFSNHSKLFHYEEELILIEEIEKCLIDLR